MASTCSSAKPTPALRDRSTARRPAFVRSRNGPRRPSLSYPPGYEAARYVRERTWHPSQRLKEQRDGRLVLTLRVSHFLEVKRWAISYGAACEVLEPAELREEVAEEIRRMAESIYGFEPLARRGWEEQQATRATWPKWTRGRKPMLTKELHRAKCHLGHVATPSQAPPSARFRGC